MPSISPFCLDGGRNEIKSAAPGGMVKEDVFKHALAEVDPSEFRRIQSRADNRDEDYFTINGVHYAIGRKAMRHRPYDRLVGEKRYVPGYYGVFAAIGMARAFRKSRKNVFFVGMHPPMDVDYRDDLMLSVIGEWEVIWRDQEFLFKVVDATTLDEPLGGFHNAILRKDGKGYADRSIEGGTTLALDIGAFTTDGIIIDPGGDIDYTSADSKEIGVHRAVQQFMKNFRTTHRNLLRGSDLDETMAQEAIRTGFFDLRGLGVVDCTLEAQEVRNVLASEVTNFYDTYGGASLYNTLLLTGGGSALLEKELRERINHKNMIFADKDIRTIHLANVRGAQKWFLMHEAIGTFS